MQQIKHSAIDVGERLRFGKALVVKEREESYGWKLKMVYV